MLQMQGCIIHVVQYWKSLIYIEPKLYQSTGFKTVEERKSMIVSTRRHESGLSLAVWELVKIMFYSKIHRETTYLIKLKTIFCALKVFKWSGMFHSLIREEKWCLNPLVEYVSEIRAWLLREGVLCLSWFSPFATCKISLHGIIWTSRRLA